MNWIIPDLSLQRKYFSDYLFLFHFYVFTYLIHVITMIDLFFKTLIINLVNRFGGKPNVIIPICLNGVSKKPTHVTEEGEAV